MSAPQGPSDGPPSGRVGDIDMGWYRQANGWQARLSWNADTGVLYVYDCDPRHLDYQPQLTCDEATARTFGERWAELGFDLFQ